MDHGLKGGEEYWVGCGRYMDISKDENRDVGLF
jgi:hypothetical protein